MSAPTRTAVPGGLRWLARDASSVPPCHDWLSEGERARAAAMRRTKRRDEYLLRRWTGKQAVIAAAGLSGDHGTLARVEVRNASDGAPEVYLDGAPWATGISLTDRAGWAACLVAGGPGGVGCDLELVEARSPGFIRDFLTEAEQRYVAGHDPQVAANVAANLVWSAKESALKVLRTGLRRDTRSVEVAASAGGNNWTTLSVRTVEGATLPGWWRRYGAFLFTIVASVPTPPPAGLDPAGPAWTRQLEARPAAGRARESTVEAQVTVR